MKTRKLGSEGPEISVIGYGAWEAGGQLWGANPPDSTVLEAMERGFESGINWVDTAEVYGSGKSEELVKRALEGRDDVMVFTKVAPQGAGSGFHAKGIKEGAGASLKRLGRDVIDLYQLHWPDPSGIPIEETWEAMAGLVEEGLVRYIGVSNFSRELIESCEAIRHIDSLQPHFSLLWQNHADVISFCASNGTGSIAYGPLGYGLLTGAITSETTFDDNDWRGGGMGMGAYEKLFAPGAIDDNLEVVERLRPIADRLDASLAQLALAWVFHQDGVTGAIAGSRSAAHVAENAAAGTIELTDKDLEEIGSVIA